MNKGKIIFRIAYSLVVSFVVCFLLYEFYSNGSVGFPQYIVCMTPMCLIWCLNWFNTIMYVKYCIKHSDEKVGFVNKDTSKVRKVVRIIILSLVAVAMLSILITLFNKNNTETYKKEIAFINDRMTFDSCTDVNENIIQPTVTFTLEEQFDYLWYYSSKSRYVVTDKSSEKMFCEAKIEYVKRLPKICSNIVFDELYKNAIESHSYIEKQNAMEGEVIYNELKINYVFFPEDNLVFLFASDNKLGIYVFEKWNDNISIDIEQRVNEWKQLIDKTKTET